ncbi:gp44 [Alphaproteobacteria phage PhiJL001]|uniref:Gp44 n=1 Tax=Alphaproteobacteria phage PhiJL001 TaxID=2681607 RepID=Q5DN61_9CAUD|nr:gp44 [Alphaproteobacteria phage PhiJL001]AAT69520.1 gp44 [Alphaproteobacteria phage PhiJL001]
MSHVITLENSKSYATEANLDKALVKLGLAEYTGGEKFACRYIKCQNGEGRWTAIFLISEYFNRNETGGYVGIASQHGFMSV